jgi:hypothetical protein
VTSWVLLMVDDVSTSTHGLLGYWKGLCESLGKEAGFEWVDAACHHADAAQVLCNLSKLC